MHWSRRVALEFSAMVVYSIDSNLEGSLSPVAPYYILSACWQMLTVRSYLACGYIVSQYLFASLGSWRIIGRLSIYSIISTKMIDLDLRYKTDGTKQWRGMLKVEMMQLEIRY